MPGMPFLSRIADPHGRVNSGDRPPIRIPGSISPPSRHHPAGMRTDVPRRAAWSARHSGARPVGHCRASPR